jgi:signal transduction histidine kinase
MEAVSGSSGLGLWIARGLANKMHGDLTYRRQSGQTLFELTLPTGHPGSELDTSTLATSTTI